MIEFRNVSKDFGSGTSVLSGISMVIPEGELVVLIGPSGSGKSTLMRLVNRLLEPTSGSVWVDGQNVAKADAVALRRNMGYVIQSIGLFPHLTARENVELVPSISGVPAAQRRQRAEELLHLMGLEPSTYGERYPRQLSGGQQQRIAIARALAADPAYLLMDEPFSALDPVTRAGLQDEFIRLKREIGKTILFVTHDVEEAVRLADRICVLGSGKVQQYATPDDILHRPANSFVAEFMGDNRELLRLGLRTARDLMRPPEPTPPTQIPPTQMPTSEVIPLGLSADRALSVLLGLGGGPVPVVDETGTIVGSLHLSDFAAQSISQPLLTAHPAQEPPRP